MLCGSPPALWQPRNPKGAEGLALEQQERVRRGHHARAVAQRHGPAVGAGPRRRRRLLRLDRVATPPPQALVRLARGLLAAPAPRAPATTLRPRRVRARGDAVLAARGAQDVAQQRRVGVHAQRLQRGPVAAAAAAAVLPAVRQPCLVPLQQLPTQQRNLLRVDAGRVARFLPQVGAREQALRVLQPARTLCG
jgi:hypothetical protein